MEYGIAYVTNGLVFLQREAESDWVISEKLTEYLVPISITMGYKKEAGTMSRVDMVREQSIDKETQVLTTLMRFVDSGHTEFAKRLATTGIRFYSNIAPLGVFMSENTNEQLMDDSDGWSEDYAKVVFKHVTRAYEIVCDSETFSYKSYHAQDLLRYYHKELAKYIKRNPDILKRYPKGRNESSEWLHNLVK